MSVRGSWPKELGLYSPSFDRTRMHLIPLGAVTPMGLELCKCSNNNNNNATITCIHDKKCVVTLHVSDML